MYYYDPWQLGQRGYLRLVACFPILLIVAFGKSESLNAFTILLSAASGWLLCHLIILAHPLTAEWHHQAYERNRRIILRRMAAPNCGAAGRRKLAIRLLKLADQNHQILNTQSTFLGLRSIALACGWVTGLLLRATVRTMNN